MEAYYTAIQSFIESFGTIHAVPGDGNFVLQLIGKLNMNMMEVDQAFTLIKLENELYVYASNEWQLLLVKVFDIRGNMVYCNFTG